MIYVLKYEEKYLRDFGYPEHVLTSDINKAAVWFSKKQIRDNFKENGYSLDKKYEFIECGLQELDLK